MCVDDTIIFIKFTSLADAKPRVLSSTPGLKHIIHVDGDRGIVGVAASADCLYVLRHPSHQQVQVYDMTTFEQQFALQVPGLSDDAWDNGLTACVVNNCLYISDGEHDAVHKVDLNLTAMSSKKIHKWGVSSNPRGLSINIKHNLLVACWSAKKIEEYTTEGTLVRDIFLGVNKGMSLNPVHAIQTTNDQFVVCCCNGTSNGQNYIVIETDAKGLVIMIYGKQKKSSTEQSSSIPCHLAIDRNNEVIFVADSGGNKILIISRSSRCRARELNVESVEGGLHSPSCLDYDESRGRLCVSESSGRIIVFDNVTTT